MNYAHQKEYEEIEKMEPTKFDHHVVTFLMWAVPILSILGIVTIVKFLILLK